MITRGYDLTMNPRYWPTRWQRCISEITVIHDPERREDRFWVTFICWANQEPVEFKNLDDLDRYVHAVYRIDLANGEVPAVGP